VYKTTRGVRLLLQDPERSLLKIAIPTIVANAIQTLYNFVDAIWVSGLKQAAFGLAGIGLTQPFAFALIALSNGIGIGTNSLISRSIGAKDKRGADLAGEHGIVFSMIVSFSIAIPLVILAPWIFKTMGAGKSQPYAVAYSRIIFGGGPVLFLSVILTAILRAEGDTKRAMYAMAGGSILNMVLDPIFIYLLHLGVMGAAIATVISRFIATMPVIYWIFMKKDTFISLNLKIFKFKTRIIKEIAKVGLPASLSQLSMSLGILFFNSLILNIAGPQGVTVYITGNRIKSLAILPALGISAALISIVGAWWGAGRKDMVRRAIIHAWKTGVKMEFFIALIVFIFAPTLTAIFINDPSMEALRIDIITYLRISSISFIFIPIGMFTSSSFNGMGKGINALILTFLRVLIVSFPSAIFYAKTLKLGLQGVWIGIVTGSITAAITGISWLYIAGILRRETNERYDHKGSPKE